MTKKHLSSLIKQSTGLSIPEFCKKYLNSDYKAFQYRRREGCLTSDEIILISWFLDEPVEYLFGVSFLDIIITQGDPIVSKQLTEIFEKADDAKKARLFQLLGNNVRGLIKTTIIPPVPIALPVAKVAQTAPEENENELTDYSLNEEQFAQVKNHKNISLPITTPAKEKSDSLEEPDFLADIVIDR